MTPYHNSVYSLVDDGFIALGDAACHTKPTCGEGCTSSLVAGKIAVEVISNLLKSDKFLTKERMWSINKRYMVAQGKDFDSMRPLLMGVISMDYDEAEYLFENDIIFSEKILGGMDTGLNLTADDIANIVKGIVKGIAKKKIRPETISKLLKGMAQSALVGAHYDNYPAHYEKFDEWKQKADEMWAKIGPVASTCDPEILKAVGIEK
jgi:flavin-dependent dehydrogenase